MSWAMVDMAAMVSPVSPGQVQRKKRRPDDALVRVRPCFRWYLKVLAANRGVPLYKVLEDVVADYLHGQRPWDDWDDFKGTKND